MLGCFRYAQFVFVSEIFLAIYWIAVLSYASFNDHDKLLAGLIFGLHYAGLIALSGLFDEITKHSESFKDDTLWSLNRQRSKVKNVKVTKRSKKPTPLGEDHSNNNVEIIDNDADRLYERKLVEKLDRYPLAYGVALFVAMISDFFSLVEAILQHKNDEISAVTYYLYVVLFAIGLFLTMSSIVWSAIFYTKMKRMTKQTSQNDYSTV